MTLHDRFDAFYMPEPNSGCWFWLGYVDKDGYGTISGQKAHRVSYKRFKGSIPPGLLIDHLCRVRCCVNPDHLEAVTLHENLKRGTGRAGVTLRTNYCNRGHELTEDNLYRSKWGRRCRRCTIDAATRSKRRCSMAAVNPN